MDKKNKILLSSVALLLVSGTAVTAGTFAWFTTVRSATISYSSATVKTNSGNLIVAYKSSLNTLAVNDATPGVIALAGANKVTDISGDGVSFYKPVWNAHDTDRTLADSIEDVSSTADGNFIDFTVTISRTNVDPETNGMYVYLGQDTSISAVDPGNPADVEAANAARLAVVNYDDRTSEGTAATNFIWALNPDANSQYISLAETGTSAYGVDGYQLTSVTADNDGDLLYSGAIKNAPTPASSVLPKIADLSFDGATPLITEDITFRVWLEGVKVQNSARGGVFKVNLDLYALEVAAA
ncbi:MAG: hypothetical protein LKE36_03535 [Bacilli bacterium]|jgi:hypothetical protein|nr:hypothetical protein [Bacilli bacterium]